MRPFALYLEVRLLWSNLYSLRMFPVKNALLQKRYHIERAYNSDLLVTDNRAAPFIFLGYASFTLSWDAVNTLHL